MGNDYEHWFADFYNRRYDAVYGYALRRANSGTAADIVSETFLIAWRKSTELTPDRELPWLFATARRVISNSRRGDERRSALVSVLSGTTINVTDPRNSIDTAAHVRVALEAMPEGDREVLLLVAWDGLDMAAAAKTVNCNAATFRVRLHRARKRFRAAWESAQQDLVTEAVEMLSDPELKEIAL